MGENGNECNEKLAAGAETHGIGCARFEDLGTVVERANEFKHGTCI